MQNNVIRSIMHNRSISYVRDVLALCSEEANIQSILFLLILYLLFLALTQAVTHMTWLPPRKVGLEYLGEGLEVGLEYLGEGGWTLFGSEKWSALVAYRYF